MLKNIRKATDQFFDPPRNLEKYPVTPFSLFLTRVALFLAEIHRIFGRSLIYLTTAVAFTLCGLFWTFFQFQWDLAFTVSLLFFAGTIGMIPEFFNGNPAGRRFQAELEILTKDKNPAAFYYLAIRASKDDRPAWVIKYAEQGAQLGHRGCKRLLKLIEKQQA